MSYPFQSVSERRVCCGRCRHQVNQERLEAGPFDSEAGLTFYCHDCHAVYGVCRHCGWYMADGKTCASCQAEPPAGEQAEPPAGEPKEEEEHE